VTACCAKCAYADALGVPADCAADKIGAGAFLENESMVFAKRLNEAIASLGLDMLAASWHDKAPQLIAAFDVWRADWARYFPTTQSRHAILVGVDDEALAAYRVDFEKWRATYTNVEKHPPSAPDPEPPKPGENRPEISIGLGGGLGFGLVALLGVFLLFGASSSSSSSRSSRGDKA